MRIASVLLFCSLMAPAFAAQADDNILTIYQQAIEFDPTLKAARFQLEISEAQRAQAGSALLPQVSASANISSNEQLEGAPVQNKDYLGQRYVASLTQTVFDAPKLLNWERFHSIVEQQEANQKDALQNLMYNVVERYFKILEYNDTLNLIIQEISSTQKELDQLRRQYEMQVVKITDVYELEAKLDSLAADKIAAATQVDIAKQNLMELTGQEVNGILQLRNDIPFEPLTGDIDTLVAQAKERNPALLAQQKSIAAAATNVDQQKARHLPTVDAQASYNNSNYGFQNTQTNTTETRVVGVNINVPLFSGGATTHATEEASKNLELNKQKQQSLLGELIREIHDAFLSTNANVQRIFAAEKALRSATKAREAMEKGFQYNMQTIGDVLVSQAREFKAKRDILQAKYEYIKQRSRFERFTGQIDEQYLAMINQWLRVN